MVCIPARAVFSLALASPARKHPLTRLLKKRRLSVLQGSSNLRSNGSKSPTARVFVILNRPIRKDEINLNSSCAKKKLCESSINRRFSFVRTNEEFEKEKNSLNKNLPWKYVLM